MKTIRNVFTRHSIIWTWIISYVTILIAPIICNIFIYMSSISSLESSTINQESEILEATVLSVDDMLYSLSATAALIENATNTNQLMNENASENDTQAFISASNFLSSHISSNENISAIYIHYPHLDKCIGNNYISGTGDFFKKYYNSQYISFKDWNDRLKSFSYGDYIIAKENEYTVNIDFFYSIPLYSFKGENRATVVIRISEDKLLSSVEKQFSLLSKNFYIVNDKSELIIKSEDIDGISLPENSNNIKDSLKAFKDCHYISYSSSAIDWNFISVIPDNIVAMQQEHMRGLMMFNSIFLFLASTVIIIVVARKNYAPIHEIKTFINNNFDSENRVNNEFERITKLLTRYSQTSRSIEQKQILNDRNFLLSHLIVDNNDTEKILAELREKYNISFNTNSFTVISFNVMNHEHLFIDDDVTINYMRKNEYIQLIISNIFEESMTSFGHYAVVFTYYGKYVSIVALDDSCTDNWKNEISAAISNMKECIYKNFQLLITANASDLHAGISTLPEAFFEAISYQNYEDDVTFYNEDSSGTIPDSVSKTKLMYLSNFIKLGSASSAKQIADTLYNEFQNFEQNSANKVFLYTLSSTIFDAAFQTSDRQYLSEYIPLYNCINKLNNLRKNQAQCKLILSEAIDVACDITRKNNERLLKAQQTDERKSPMSTEFIHDVKEYVEENYDKFSLNVASIGRHFELSSYYISNQFKKNEGISLPDYISKVRIRKAKELMFDTDKPLSEISELVGFGSVRTFTRAFQKLEDVLPNQFKKMNEKRVEDIPKA